LPRPIDLFEGSAGTELVGPQWSRISRPGRSHP